MASDSQLHPDFKSGRVVATQKARGLIRAFTYYFLAYLFFVIVPTLEHKEGIFAEPGWLAVVEFTCIAIMGFLAYPDAIAFTRIAAASCAREQKILSGVVGGSEGQRATEWIFERPTALLDRRTNFKKPLEAPVDCPPMLLWEPIDVLGTLIIAIDGKPLIASPYDVELVGFDRYQVRDYPEMLSQTPHILTRLVGGQRVQVVGEFSFVDDEVRLSPGCKLILVDPNSLDAFIAMNMCRLVFLAAASAMLAIKLLG